MSKKLYIKTMGCQMNVYDSQKMVDMLSSLGYSTTETPDDSDLMILNTCHIREKATEKVFSDLGRLRDIRNKKPKGEQPLIAVAGCVAQAEGELVAERAPYVDMVFGPQSYHQLPEMILKANGNERVVITDFPEESKFDTLPHETTSDKPSAFIAIQEGCDKFCTFCVVPYTRGPEFSRPPEQIMDEAKKLADQGIKEITLLGQNVNAYNNGWHFAELIANLAEINGLERIRYTTSHPNDMTDELIAAHRDIPKLMPYLHLPVQSGSNRILELMNRKHTAEKYLDILERVRAARPDIAFSSDFIVGFPGETDEDFEDTMNVVRKVGYGACYSFKYSPRPGTPGAAMGNMVAEHVKDARLKRLQELLVEQQAAFNAKAVGQIMPVLFDRKGSKEGQLLGKTPYNQSVYVEAPARLYGEIIDVKIEKTTYNGLTGSLVMVDEEDTEFARTGTRR